MHSTVLIACNCIQYSLYILTCTHISDTTALYYALCSVDLYTYIHSTSYIIQYQPFPDTANPLGSLGTESAAVSKAGFISTHIRMYMVGAFTRKQDMCGVDCVLSSPTVSRR